jgi:hypothetical protein
MSDPEMLEIIEREWGCALPASYADTSTALSISSSGIILTAWDTPARQCDQWRATSRLRRNWIITPVRGSLPDSGN